MYASEGGVSILSMFPLFGVPHLVLSDGLRKKAWECWAWKRLTEWVTWSWILRTFPGISKLRGRALIIPLFQIRGKETSVRWGWQVTFGKGLAHDWLLPLGAICHSCRPCLRLTSVRCKGQVWLRVFLPYSFPGWPCLAWRPHFLPSCLSAFLEAYKHKHRRWGRWLNG